MSVPDVSVLVPDLSEQNGVEVAPPVSSGGGWGTVVLVLLALVLVSGMVVLYRKPEARERVFRVLQETKARMPVVLGGRGRDDSTLLISNGNMSASAFESLTDDDDFS